MLQEQFQEILGEKFVFYSFNNNNYYGSEEYDDIYTFLFNHVGNKSEIKQIIQNKIYAINKLKLNDKEIKKIYVHDMFDSKILGYQIVIAITKINFKQIEINKCLKERRELDRKFNDLYI